jgi:regulator of protease activity HflC (stomatin/prohibitin superfamily)
VILALALVLIFLAVTALVIAGTSVRVLREYERGVVFRLGRVTSQRGPGLIFLHARDRSDGPRQPAHGHARDPGPGDHHARQRARTRYRGGLLPGDRFHQVGARDRERAGATSQIAQTTLRSVLGKAELDALLAERERLNEHLQHIIDDQTEPWGVKVTAVEIKDVEIPSGCSTRWRARPRPSASGARRSSTPRANSRPPPGSTTPPT